MSTNNPNAVSDLLLDPTSDLLIQGGDFVIGLSDEQHVYCIIKANPGDWKQTPWLGASIDRLAKADPELRQTILKNIKLMLASDGYKSPVVATTNGNLSIDTTRT